MLLKLYHDWEGESIWKRAGGFPVDKAGVRQRLIVENGIKEDDAEEQNVI